MQLVGDTVVRNARRPPYPQTRQNLQLYHYERNQPTLTNYTIHTLTNQDATNQHQNGRAGYTNNIRRYDHRQQRDGANATQADHDAAKTTAHQPHRSCSRPLTVNRRHASRPTPNQPGVHGSRRERRPTGLATLWCATPADDHTHEQNRGLYHHATDQPTLTNYAKPLNDRPTNHNDLLRTLAPPGERKLDRVRRRECAPRHASPIARASSSRLTPTENQPRWGCLEDRAFGLAPGPWAPESGG